MPSALCPLLFACLYRPPAPEPHNLIEIAAQFSPRYEQHRDDLVSIDVRGLERLLGPAQAIGEELRRTAAARGVRLHIAIARSRIAALVLALARPGLTIVAPGDEAAALAPIAIGILEKIAEDQQNSVFSAVKHWGLKTLGDLAALPPADLAARLGRSALAWQAMARGEDTRPLVPMVEAERFEASLELDWPIDGLEPLSFVLTRLLEPLSTRLERRDRGVAVLHVLLRLVTKDASGTGHEMYTRRLELPTPMRDVRALRTLALLDLGSHPPGAAIDRVTIAIDPTPGRVLQHTLFTRAQPAPEQVSTLLARLGALMGQDRVGAPAVVDSDRPGAFAMTAFTTDHARERAGRNRGEREERKEHSSDPCVCAALRRCRQPVPARVAIADGRPIRVTTDRRGFAGGAVVQCAGPWRTSGNWWAGEAGGAVLPSWNRDEWDVALGDGAVYRIFQDRATDAWFVDAIVD
jgi:protein ImuB